MPTVRCRACLGHNCSHGLPEDAVYGREESMRSDGTWDGLTVICTPCYMRLIPFTPSGQGLREELPLAIKRYRDAQLPMEERVQRFKEINERDGVSVVREDREDGIHLLVMENGAVEGHAILRGGRPLTWV